MELTKVNIIFLIRHLFCKLLKDNELKSIMFFDYFFIVLFT